MKFFSEIIELGRSTQVVSAQSWHAKMYSYWRQHGLFKMNNYRENLCHYVRVVLIWAPIAWMLNARLIKEKIRPITALFTLAYATLGIGAVAASNSAITVAALMFGPPALLLLVIGLEKVYPGKMLSACKNVGSVLEPPVTWCFNARLIAWVRPYMIAFAIVMGLLSWDNPKFLISLAAAIVVCSIMVCAAYIAHRHDERKKQMRDLERQVATLESELRRSKFHAEIKTLSHRLINRMITMEEYTKLADALIKQICSLGVVAVSSPKKIRSDRTNPLAESFRLGIRFAAAKKHKICPFIVFEDDENMQLSA